jgi:AmmeMemoRadiSam system protein A
MNSYILLAKQAIENYIQNKKTISLPDDLPKEFINRRAGTFVTIEKNGELRGCIGTYLATRKNIAEEIIHNAIAAATEDYRFGLITKEELPELSYTIYILSEPELVKDIKDPTKFSEENFRRAGLDQKKYGIIVKTAPLSPTGDVVFNGHFIAKTGLLLPDLENINTIEKQIFIACQKGGIDPRLEKIIIYKFSVEKYQ